MTILGTTVLHLKSDGHASASESVVAAQKASACARANGGPGGISIRWVVVRGSSGVNWQCVGWIRFI